MVRVYHKLLCIFINLEQHILPFPGLFIFIFCTDAPGRILSRLTKACIIGDSDGDEIIKLLHITYREIIGLNFISLILILLNFLLLNSQILFSVQNKITHIHCNSVPQGCTGIFR